MIGSRYELNKRINLLNEEYEREQDFRRFQYNQLMETLRIYYPSRLEKFRRNVKRKLEKMFNRGWYKK